MTWGLTMASASTGTAIPSSSHSAVTSASKAAPTPSPAKGTGHHCTHLKNGRGGAPSSAPGALPG